MTKKEIIEDIAWEYTNAYNKSHGKDYGIDALYNFGSLGLHSIKELTEMFYSEIEKRKNKTNKSKNK